MIHISVSGGVGNQLFQYAFAKEISKNTGQNISIDTFSLKKDNQRAFKLNCFSIENLKVSLKLKNILFNPDFNILLKLLLKINKKWTCKLLEKLNVIYYTDSIYKKINYKKKKDIYIYGYFQSEKFFKKNKNIIKEEFEIPNSYKYENLKEKIKNCNAVCVHCRFGDYRLKKNFKYQVCNKNYYLNAINKMKQLYPDSKFYIFSDEIDFAKKMFKNMDDIIYISNIDSDIEELYLMTLCKNYIISNSTFSWWGQYLSKNNKHVTIAPKKWQNNDRKFDIYQDDWILI